MRRTVTMTMLLLAVVAWPAAADDGLCDTDPAASFCAGPSDQPANVADGYVFAGCQPDTSDVLVVGQVRAVSGTVDATLDRDGTVVDAATLTHTGHGDGTWLTDVLPAGETAVYRLSAGGVTLDVQTVTADGCVPLPDVDDEPTSAPVAAPAADGVETLPHTGVGTTALVIVGAVLLMVGAWLAGRPRA